MKNPIFVLALLLCVGLSARAATYYVSSSSGNDSYTPAQAQNPATPWRSLGKVNSYWGSLNPGDTIKLQAGSSFNQPLNIWKSGTAAQPIVITAYGTGYAPVITGFTELSGWGGGGGNVWQTTCSGCLASANMVMIGDSSKPMGRWPGSWSNADAGYSQIQSYNGTVSITDSHIGATGHNWVGSNVVIRKNRWVIETDPITAQSGNTISYTTGSAFAPAVNYGYFIQGSAYSLSKQGDWYYNPANKLVQVYSAGSPASMNMMISEVDTLLQFNGVQYVVVNGIEFEGANYAAVTFYNSNYITMENCSIKFSGRNAVGITTCNYLTFNNVRIDYTNNNGFFAYCNNSTIENCIVQRTAAFPGMNLPVNSGIGIYLVGNNNTVTHNTIDTTGYTAISFQGNSNTISNNFINYFCFVKDDGGGIYTWNGNSDSTNTHTTGWITNNIVLNGITAPAGTDSSVAGIAHGIYLDENTTECDVTGNTVANCTGGIFIQDVRGCEIENNTLFNNPGQIILRHALSTGAFSGNNISGNYCVSYPDTQYIMVISSIGPSSAMPRFGYFNNNHYAQLTPSSNFYLADFTNSNTTGSFGSWQSNWGEDIAPSDLLPVNFAPYTVSSYIGSNMYTKGNITLPFLDALLGVRVITSAGIGAIDSGYYYVLNYTMVAPDNAHTMINFLEVGVSPYPQLSPVTSTPTATPSSNNTIVWQAKGTNSNALLVFQINSNVPTLALSNISLYHANVTPNNPANDYIFHYNASNSAVSLPLSGTWEDAAGNTHSGSVSIPAWGSVILISK